MINFDPEIIDYMEIADLIKQMREKYGFSQKQIALTAEIEPTRYNRFESAKNKSIRLSDFIKLIKVYGPGAFRDFIEFLESNEIRVLSELNEQYQNIVEETTTKYMKAEENKKNMEKEAQSLKNDVDMLKKIIDSKDENIRLMREIIDLKKMKP